MFIVLRGTTFVYSSPQSLSHPCFLSWLPSFVPNYRELGANIRGKSYKDPTRGNVWKRNFITEALEFCCLWSPIGQLWPYVKYCVKEQSIYEFWMLDWVVKISGKNLRVKWGKSRWRYGRLQFPGLCYQWRQRPTSGYWKSEIVARDIVTKEHPC